MTVNHYCESQWHGGDLQPADYMIDEEGTSPLRASFAVCHEHVDRALMEMFHVGRKSVRVRRVNE